MKSTFSSSTITIAFLILTAVSNAQNKQLILNQPDHSTIGADTLKKINFENGIVASHELDSQKIKKGTRRSSVQKETYNPYQLYNPARTTLPYNGSLPYNNYKEKDETILSVAGHILISILADKTHHNF